MRVVIPGGCPRAAAVAQVADATAEEARRQLEAVTKQVADARAGIERIAAGLAESAELAARVRLILPLLAITVAHLPCLFTSLLLAQMSLPLLSAALDGACNANDNSQCMHGA